MSTGKLTIGALGLLLSTGLATTPASAQLEVVGYGAAEWDAEELELYLIGAAVQPSGLGLQPTANVAAYRLTYPVGLGETFTVNALNPSAGLRYQWPVGAVQARAGYLFLDEEEENLIGPAFGAPGGGSEGVTTTVQADYWGTGLWNALAIVNYNWGADYLWSNLRGMRQIATVGGGGLSLGAEVVAQGGGETPGEDYEAFQIGPIVGYQVTESLRLTGVVGYKTDNRDEASGGEDSGFPYYKVEFLLVP